MAWVTEKKQQKRSGLIYKALWTQAGTAAPTAVELVNDFPNAVTLSRTGVGIYRLVTTGGPFTAGKTIGRSRILDQATGRVVTVTWIDINTIEVRTGVSAGALADVLLSGTEIEFAVYS